MDIIGVYPMSTKEPCHMIEADFESTDTVDDLDWGEVTQENPNQPRENWQVAYDEQAVNECKSRWICFFHFLDVSMPLITPVGNLHLPEPTPIPDHLQHIQYHEP